MLNDPSCVNYKDVATMTLEMVVTKGGYPQTVSFKHSRGWPATEDWWHYYRSVSRKLINLPVERNSRGFRHWSEVFPLTCVFMPFLGRTTSNCFFWNKWPQSHARWENGHSELMWQLNWLKRSMKAYLLVPSQAGNRVNIAGERTSDFQRKI